MSTTDILFLGLAIIIVIAGIIAMIRHSWRPKGREDFRFDDREAWAKRWNELEAMLNEGESHWQVAIIEADKLLDRILKSMKIPGNTMGERLRFITLSRTDLKFVWSAHLLRNQLAHESDMHLDRRQAVETLNTFKQALKKLGVL